MKAYIKDGHQTPTIDRPATMASNSAWCCHRPTDDDDGVKHCFALPKTSSRRVAEGVAVFVGCVVAAAVLVLCECRVRSIFSCLTGFWRYRHVCEQVL